MKTVTEPMLLAALKAAHLLNTPESRRDITNAIEAALKEREDGCKYPTCHSGEYQAALTKDLVQEFFTAPPKAQPMSEEQAKEIIEDNDWYNFPEEVIRATEKFHKITGD